MSRYIEFLNKKIKEVKEYWTWSEAERLLELDEDRKSVV